ncbi:Ig-like domain repeat protein [Streptomyces sp. NBC_00654]|uniref:Ig-like domain repeat protein n=1 Tax=Streptomyces sp. NBC_00654 TaxID=2975799 RepID=UPI00225B92C7|nr:Ig-like domain repeat protein [Streptomyces sp. NBC_00654]MCX4964479.1 Ig-like domain repeat protein [Streptomyces sp. NBC_00654]
MKNSRHRIRTAATLTALTLGTAGLTALGAPAAMAAGERVAKLPVSSYSAMVVDSARERVYISDDTRSRNAGQVLVYNFAGEKVGSLTTDTSPSGMALSTDGSTLHVSQSTGILSFDTGTQTRTGQAYANYHVECPRDVAFAGGKQWYTEVAATSDCDTRSSRLYMAEGSGVVNTGWNDLGRLRLWSGPEAPGRLLMGQPRTAGVTDPFLTAFDATGSTLVRGPERRFADAAGKGALDLKDVAQSADGQRIAVADAAAGTRLLDAADLSDAPVAYQPLPEGATASAVSFSGDGKYIARGAAATGGTADLLVQPADPADRTAPLEFAFDGALEGNRVAPRGLGWSQDGARLFAVTTNGSGNEYWLHIIQPPAAQHDSRFTGTLGTTPGQAVVGEPLGIRGRLELDGPAPAEPVKVSAVRHDANGDRRLAAVEVDADGSFTVLDVPALVGDATYTVSYTGDLTHRPAQDVTLAVAVAKAPTALALTAPAEGVKGEGLEITGRLTGQGRALPAGITLTVERADKKGTGVLTSAAVAADGTFRINDLPRATGQVTYTVGYAGDDLHSGSTASATVRVRRAG